MFLERYKIYKLSDKLSNASFILKLIKKLEGVKAVMLISISDNVPISSILPKGVNESKYATMTIALFNLIQKACLGTNKGNFKLSYIEGEDGKLLVKHINKGLILSISFDSTISNDVVFNLYIKIIQLMDSPLSALI